VRERVCVCVCVFRYFSVIFYAVYNKLSSYYSFPALKSGTRVIPFVPIHLRDIITVLETTNGFKNGQFKLQGWFGKHLFHCQFAAVLIILQSSFAMEKNLDCCFASKLTIQLSSI
jgi:hypothetical protein